MNSIFPSASIGEICGRNRSLPRNICEHPDGLLVRVQRGDVLFQAFVPKSRADALTIAIKLRDRFLKIAGPESSHRGRQRPRSNTGVSGVSETTMWSHGRPYPCFCVNWSRAGKPGMKRVQYRGMSDRESALRQAIALRARNTGEDTAALLRAAESCGVLA